MSALNDLLQRGRRITEHAPWPRVVVDVAQWRRAIDGLAAGHWHLTGLWAADDGVHLALLDDQTTAACVFSLPCPERAYPAVSRHHPPALRLERALRDLYGIEPEGMPDARPWLDHGHWGVRHPLGRRVATDSVPPPYPFLTSLGDDLHQIPVGPVHAGIIEPGHFRFTASGETVVRLEQRLGYVHKGIEGLAAGATVADAARLAGRTSGDSTVAYAFAFARAVEAALGVAVPPRAVWLRALMAELERLANHFGDIGAVCNDASFGLMHAHCGVLRENVLRAADAAFGHRLMRDAIVPGGIAQDIARDGGGAIAALIREAQRRFPALVELYDKTASLQDRTVSTGILKPKLARQYAAGGYIGRASGRGFDARRMLAYPPYGELTFDVPVRHEGDVNARVWIRIEEVRQSLSLLEQILGRLPDGAVHAPLPASGAPREGMAIVEAFRGDILAWVRLAANGTVERCHLRDASWFQWPLLEAAIEGNIVADFPLCNKSFNCSYSGHDL
ncbi:MAG: NADH-quinone oxidoreductase subunit C [Alphaproteobacteria bacterium]